VAYLKYWKVLVVILVIPWFTKMEQFYTKHLLPQFIIL